MAGPDYVGDLMVDGFLIEKLATGINCNDPKFNDPLQNIIKKLGKLSKPMLDKISKALGPSFELLLHDPRVGVIAELVKEFGPFLGPFVAMILRMFGIVVNWKFLMAITVAEFTATLLMKFRSKVQGSLISFVWKFLKVAIGQLQWSLLWNPWFIAGAIALAGALWLIVKWFTADPHADETQVDNG